MSSLISRRQMLLGAGSAAIALPALEILRPRTAHTAPEADPTRVVTIFFGQGLPQPMFEQPANGQVPVFSGSLEPLAPFANQLALVTGVGHVSAGGDPHDVGPQSAFSGFAPRGKGSGGPTIDQVVYEELHPDAAPTRIPTLSTGSFHREGGLLRHVHSWNSKLSPAALPVEQPAELFRQAFGGGVDPAQPSAEAMKQAHYRRSVLDAVLESYQHSVGAASPYGVVSKQRITEHLERVRELEMRVFAPQATTCALPAAPGQLAADKAQANERDGGGPGGIDVDANEWQAVWRSLIDLYVLALQCDITRFGNIIFQSGGDRVRVHGNYEYNGKLIAEFDDRETTHEYFHGWQNGAENRLVNEHVHFIMAQVGYVLERMSATESAPGGASLLDESLVMISTELSDTSSHSYRGVFHAMSGCGGRFKAGTVQRAPADTLGPDLYNGCLQGLGLQSRMGDPSARKAELTSIIT